jgi:ABC-type multidrug transport system fused ATPase/permease subunit
MGVRPRRPRDLFHQVTGFSAREVGQFGAPSLITRITNDVQQVQMLVQHVLHDDVAAPIMIVIGVDHGRAEDTGLSVVLLVAMPALVLRRADRVRMVPRSSRCRSASTGQPVLREQITGIRVVRAFVRDPRSRPASARQRRAHRDLAAHRPAHGGDVPDRHAGRERVERRRALVRRRPDQPRRDAGRVARRVPELPRPDPHGGDDGDVRGDR